MECINPLMLLLPILILLSSVNIVLANTSPPITFCSRALASKSCPTPPTFDSINLQAYLGHWFEIGSTASFKLLTEGGLVCDQAQYSAASGKVSLVNSGLKVIGPLAIAEVQAVSLAAGGVCTGGRDICYDLAPSSGISQALHHISNAQGNLTNVAIAALLSQVSQKLLISIEATETALQGLANNIKQIQQLNSQLSQANASLPYSINAIKSNVNQAQKEQVAISNLVEELSKAASEATAISKKLSPEGNYAKQELAQATISLTEAAAKVATTNAAMEASLGAIEAGAGTLLLDGQPIADGKASSVKGGISQDTSSQGKLEVSINGVKAPYWILQVEGDGRGGYGAALVYSCREIAGKAAKSLFILAREPYLDERVVDSFLKQAELYGIYNNCEDPFLFTVQRGGNCGNPTA